MAVALRGNYGSSTADLTKPVNLADGDLIVVVAQRNNATPPSLPASGWTSVLTKVATDSSSSLRLAYRHVTTASSEPATYTFTNATAIIAVVVYNHHQTNPIFYSDSQSIDSTAVTLSPSGFTLNSDEFYSFALVSAAVTTGVNATSAPTNWSHYRFQARMKLARYDMPAATYSSIVYTYGTTAQKLVGVLFVIRPVILPPVATSTASMPAPAAITAVNGLVSATVATALSASLAPSVLGGAAVSAPTASSSAQMLAPSVVGAALVVAAQATAAGNGLAPGLIYNGVVAATVAGASAALAEPVVAGGAVATATAMNAAMAMAAPSATGAALLAAVAATATSQAEVPSAIQSITAPLMSIVMMAHGSETRGGALISPDVSAVIANIHTPLPQLLYIAPVMSLSASAFGATAFGSAVTTSLLGVAAMNAVAPKAGVLRQTDSWKGNQMSVTGRVNSGSATKRAPSSAQMTRQDNDASSDRRVSATVTLSSPNGVTATQQERSE